MLYSSIVYNRLQMGFYKTFDSCLASKIRHETILTKKRTQSSTKLTSFSAQNIEMIPEP